MAFGNTNASSLLRAANAGLVRQQSYQDSIQAYTFELSAKTQDDFVKYADYLGGRLKATSDPVKALSLQKTLTSSHRAFTSSEIARNSLAVKYGDISNRDKLNNLVDLQKQAIENGDMGLAQSIDSQLASLSITIQNEDQAAAGRAQAGYSASVSSEVKKQKDMLKQADIALAKGQITAAEHASLLAGVDPSGNPGPVKALEALYTQYANDPNLTDAQRASYNTDLESLQTNDTYQKAITQNQKFNEGQTPTAVKFNAQTGQYETTPLQQVGINQQLDAKGNIVGVAQMGTGDKNSFLSDYRTGSDGVLADSQTFVQPFTTDAAGNNLFTRPRTPNNVVANIGDTTTPTLGLIQPNANLGTNNPQGYGLVLGSDGKYRESNSGDFSKGGPAAIVQDNPYLQAIAKGASSLKDSIGGGINALRGNRLAQSIPGVSNALSAIFSRSDKAQADARIAASLQQAHELAQQREAASRAALAAVAPQTTTNSLGTKLVGPAVQGAPKVPAAVVQAQNTVGTQAFTEKYLPVIKNLKF